MLSSHPCVGREFPETLVPVALQGRRSRHVLAGAVLGSLVRQRCGLAAACAGGREPWTSCRSAPRLLALWHVPQCVLESRESSALHGPCARHHQVRCDLRRQEGDRGPYALPRSPSRRCARSRQAPTSLNSSMPGGARECRLRQRYHRHHSDTVRRLHAGVLQRHWQRGPYTR